MGATVSKAEHVGKRLGRAWRWFVRQEVRLAHWMMSNGISQRVAIAILWTVKLAVLVVVLYAAFWMAMVLAIVLIAAVGARGAGEGEQPEWLEKDPDDHREDLFYDPLSHNHDPDPRFDDPRHRNK